MMKTRKIGPLTVSPIGMGCMAFSHGYGKIPDASYSIEAIRMAHDDGCTFFDTAEVYGPELHEPGHNERLLGCAVSSFRDDIAIATKLFLPREELKEHSLYEVIRAHLIGSLERLQTDYADLYYLHRVDLSVPIEDVAEVMGRLIDEGLIRSWGLSQVGVDMLERAHAVTPVSAVQNLYNMMERDCEKEILPFCLEHDIALVPFSPVASGLLSGRITQETAFEQVDDVRNVIPQLSRDHIVHNMPFIDHLRALAEKKQATPAQLSLAWMLYKYPNIIPIPGSKSKEHILENLGAWNVELTETEFTEIEQMLDQQEVYGHRGNVEYIEA